MTVHANGKVLIKAIQENATSFLAWVWEDWELQWLNSYALGVISHEHGCRLDSVVKRFFLQYAIMKPLCVGFKDGGHWWFDSPSLSGSRNVLQDMPHPE